MEFKLRPDPKPFHHYIIAVGIYSMKHKEKAGKMFLKYKPLHFTNNDIKKLDYASRLSKDKLFKTTIEEALKCSGCETLNANFYAIKMGAMANQCTLHHFESAFEIEEKDFEILVEAANVSDSTKKLLLNSMMKG